MPVQEGVALKFAASVRSICMGEGGGNEHDEYLVELANI
jgi:hypothetical protein